MLVMFIDVEFLFVVAWHLGSLLRTNRKLPVLVSQLAKLTRIPPPICIAFAIGILVGRLRRRKRVLSS